MNYKHRVRERRVSGPLPLELDSPAWIRIYAIKVRVNALVKKWLGSFQFPRFKQVRLVNENEEQTIRGIKSTYTLILVKPSQQLRGVFLTFGKNLSTVLLELS